MIYMDNAATTRPCYPAAQEMAITPMWGNANSAHRIGNSASDMLSDARKMIANCINAPSPDMIFFTSGATQACQLAIRILRGNSYSVYCDPTSHDCVLDEALPRALTGRLPKSFGYASIFANNEVGTISHRKNEIPGCLWFSDATAALGHIPVDVQAEKFDMIAGGAHKFGGYKGIGFVYVNTDIFDPSPTLPLLGTPPVELIYTMAVALEYHTEHMEQFSRQEIEMRDYMIESLLKIPGSHLNGPWTAGNCTDRLPGNVNVSFDGISGATLAAILSERYNICVSTGSACNTGNPKPSHVLTALGVPEDLALGTIRITLSAEENDMTQCQMAVNAISDTVDFLRHY